MSLPRRVAQAVRSLPLKARWLVAIVFYALVILAVVLAVRHGDSEGIGAAGGNPQEEAAAAAEANREGRKAIERDETPHTARLSPGVPVLSELKRLIASDARARMAHGELSGPLQSVRCEARGPAKGASQPFDCTVRSAGADFPFLAVADESSRRLTWCKVDPPPVAGEPLEVPVSPKCRA